jgi:ribosomal protein L29
MTEQRPLATERINERLDQLNQELVELRQAEQRAAIGAVALVNNVQTANIKAILEIIQILGAEIDQLRSDTNSS